MAAHFTNNAFHVIIAYLKNQKYSLFEAQGSDALLETSFFWAFISAIACAVIMNVFYKKARGYPSALPNSGAYES